MVMRKTVVAVILIAAATMPSAAQFREALPSGRPPVRLYPASGTLGSVMSKLFNPSVFKMSHGFEMSAGTFGGHGYSMGMYTNTMAWQFGEKFAMRADVAFAYSPQNQNLAALGLQNNGPKVFLRNAEIAWHPAKNVRLHIQVRQDPYGYRNPYASPYDGYLGRRSYGYGAGPLWYAR